MNFLTIAGSLLLTPLTAARASEGTQDIEVAPVFTHWRSFGVNDGLPGQKATCVLVDEQQGDVWVGTERGLARLKDGIFSTLTRRDGLVYPVISSLTLCERTGDLWIGTLGGISRYSAGRFDSFNQLNSGLINDVVYAVEVVDGVVWAATASGVSLYDPERNEWQQFDHENTVMHEPWCYGITEAPGKVYVAVWGGGVVEYDRKHETWKAYRDPDHEMEIDLYRDDGLIHDVTSGVSQAEGVLWISTYFGLSRYDGRLWKSYLEHDTGLPSNFINTVRARGRWVWLSTDDGLAAFDGERWIVYRNAGDPSAGSVRIVAQDLEQERLPTDGSLAHNFVLGAHPLSDRVWVATSGGLSLGSLAAEPEGVPPRTNDRSQTPIKK